MVHRRLVPGFVHLLLWLAGRRRAFRVTGHSMAPTFAPGDLLLVDPRVYRRSGPRAGDVVVSRHPYRTDVRLVKRVSSLPGDGLCLLEGDNPEESTDSRIFGPVPNSLLLGRVAFRFRWRRASRLFSAREKRNGVRTVAANR